MYYVHFHENFIFERNIFTFDTGLKGVMDHRVKFRKRPQNLTSLKKERCFLHLLTNKMW